MNVGLRVRPWVGLDVGDYSVKLLALQPGVGGARHAAAETRLRRSSPEMPVSAEQLAQAVGECLAQAQLSPRSIRGMTLGLSGADVIVKQISLPIMDDAEVPGALRFEARKHLPFDPQTCVIDYQVLGRYPSEKRLETLLAAVPRTRLDRALGPLKSLGFEPDIVDAAPLALANALARGSDRDTEACVMLDLGYLGSWLTVYQRGAPFLARRLEFGGASLTEAVSSALGIPFDEAEEWKVEAGADDSTLRIGPESPEMRALHEGLEVLAEELRRSFAFYRTLAPIPDPMMLWISGHTARLPGIAGALSQMLEMPTMVFNPFESLGGEPGPAAPKGGPQFAQAYGLALRAA